MDRDRARSPAGRLRPRARHPVPVRRQAGAGWRGIIDCEVLEVREPSLLRYSWTDDGTTTYVTYRIEPHGGGTRFTYAHAGFTGAGGFFLAKLLGSVRKKMLTAGLPAVLRDLDDDGALRATSTLRARSL